MSRLDALNAKLQSVKQVAVSWGTLVEVSIQGLFKYSNSVLNVDLWHEHYRMILSEAFIVETVHACLLIS